MKKSLISSHFAHHRPRDKLVTYYLYCYDLHQQELAQHILKHDNPIEDGETIDGVADGQMSREIQWKCQYEDALIQPPREVLDIHMGNYASGGR